MVRLVALVAGVIIVACGLASLTWKEGWIGTPPGPGIIEGAGLPRPVIEQRAERRKQILFGDLHVHTTYSSDAALWSLPLNNGSGAHPIGEACDYARFCSGIDFWAITDHASALTPRKWRETKDSIRQCQALSGDPGNPDLISLIGFEWTQVGTTPDNHYGHKNVIFEGLADDQVAKRPIGAPGLGTQAMREFIPKFPPAIAFADPHGAEAYIDFNAFLDEVRALQPCDMARADEDQGDCYEETATPGALVARLEEQNLSPLLIPHGTTWGLYTPAGTKLDKHLKAENRPEAFPLVEIYSGHGNAEEFRAYKTIEFDAEGRARCPAPRPNFVANCHQAGEIIRARCLAIGEDAAECDTRAAQARSASIRMGLGGQLAAPGARIDEWKDAEQCRDCFLPAFKYRPRGSIQYGLALTDPDSGNRFRWGFIAASDNHKARPGTGYKPVDRMNTTESWGAKNAQFAEMMDMGENVEKPPLPVYYTQEELQSRASMAMADFERQSSFWFTGGLAGVHATGRSREALFDAMRRRETYGTSGHRILLWFDLLNGPDAVKPMGSAVTMESPPFFRVRAIGSFKQKPGCPDYAAQGLSAERLARLCANECDNPSDERRLITRIEVVRIRPQIASNEPVDGLIDDPFLVHRCEPDTQGCSLSFTDPEFGARDAVYYVRAIEEPTDTINGKMLGCTYDDQGNCIAVDPCHGDYRTPRSDNCAAPAEHRAWSSPIFVDVKR